MLTWIFFCFVAFGAKALLAFAMIYLIFPADRVCSGCDGETLPIRMGVAGRMLSRLSFGYVQRRWCPRCGWEGLTRTGRLILPDTSTTEMEQAPTRRG